MALNESKQPVDNRVSPRYWVRVYEDDSEPENPQVQAFIPIDTSGNAVNLAALSVTTTPAAVTAASPTFATVGVASNLALGPGTYKQITFVITTAANVSLGFDAAAVLNSGVTMIGRGASYTLDGPITLATGVNAIASAAATNLAIQAFT